MKKKTKNKKILLFESGEGEEFTVTQETFNRAVRYLKDDKKKDKIQANRAECNVARSRSWLRFEQYTSALRCRQLPSIANELRRAILKQEWNQVATLAMMLCRSRISRYSFTIIRTCILLLFNHPKSNPQLLKNFIRNSTGYILPEDICKFIKILLMFKDKIPLLQSGKYVRHSNPYKVVDDMCFKDL